MISVAELPTDHVSGYLKFINARAVTSASGQGAIVQMGEYFYELSCEIIDCSWSILTQKLDLGVFSPVMMNLENDYACDSCKAGFFGHFCEGKYKFANLYYQTKSTLYYSPFSFCILTLLFNLHSFIVIKNF